MGSQNNIALMSKIEKHRNIETVNKPAVASPTRTILPITEVIRRLNLYLSGTVSVDAGGVDGVLTGENVLSLIRAITIEATSSSRREIGKIKYADFAAYYRLQQFLKGLPGSYLDPTPITKGSVASPFNANVSIDFEQAFSQDPRQTLLNTTELTSLSLIVDWGDSSDMFSAGTITFPACTLRVDASEFVDAPSKAQKYGLNQFSFIEPPSTTAANTRLAVDLKRGYLLRGFMVKQFTRTANAHTPVSTVVNNVSLELNREVRKSFSWATLQASNKEQFQIATMPTGYAFVDLMPEGRYDSIVDTREFRDVNVILDVNGVANSFVRIYPVEIIPSVL